MENTTAYYVTNNAYDSIVIPARNVCIIHPDALAIEFHSGDANFADWDGASIKDQVAPINIEDLSEHQIAELFGEIVESKQQAKSTIGMRSHQFRQHLPIKPIF